MRLEPSPVEAMCKHYIWLVWLLFAGPSMLMSTARGSVIPTQLGLDVLF